MDNGLIKILILDDEQDITELSNRILKREGFTTYMATDGPKALEIFQKEHPQISIIDVHLGDSPLDGIDVLAKIRELDKAAECIMVTRITDPATVLKAQQLGVKNYLLKPINAEKWLDVIIETASRLKGGK